MTYFMARLFRSLPGNLMFPAFALLVGWYAGAKIGAPDWVLNTVDGVLEEAGDLAGSILPGGEEESPAEETSTGTEV